METKNNTILLSVKNHVGTITLNRPKFINAFNDELIFDFTKHLEKIKSDKSIRVVILTGKGKHFCAGADLNWMKKMANFSEKENIKDALKLAELLRDFYTLPQPTIGLIQGSAFGGGVGLAACCDIAIASQNAQFCLSEVKLGLIPAVINPYLAKCIGIRALSRYTLTAERFDSNKAQEIGLIHQIFSENELEATGQHFAKLIKKNSPNAISQAKQQLQTLSYPIIDESIVNQTVYSIASLRKSVEGKEGIKSFLEKRLPNWTKQR